MSIAAMVASPSRMPSNADIPKRSEFQQQVPIARVVCPGCAYAIRYSSPHSSETSISCILVNQPPAGTATTGPAPGRGHQESLLWFEQVYGWCGRRCVQDLFMLLEIPGIAIEIVSVVMQWCRQRA